MSDPDDEIHVDPALAPEETQAPENKPHKGQWKPGTSGNMAGRPKKIRNIQDLREAARDKSGAMLNFLAATALNAKAPLGVRVACATEVLNRGYGRPHQSMDLNHGVQSDLAALLEEIDGRNKIKTIEGTISRPALEAQQPLLDHRQGGQEDEIPTQLGSDESAD